MMLMQISEQNNSSRLALCEPRLNQSRREPEIQYATACDSIYNNWHHSWSIVAHTFQAL